MKTARIYAMLLLAVLTVGMLAGCNAENIESIGKNNRENQIILGTSADYAPFEFHMVIGGQDMIVGADIDLAEKIAADMGKELVIRDLAFETLLDELNAGNIDFVISDMVATDDRLAKADASNEYYSEDFQRIVFLASDKDKYTDFASLANCQLAVQRGSIQVGLAHDNLPDCFLLEYMSIPDMMNALASGDVDALLVSGNVAESYVAANSNLALLDEDFPETVGSCVWVAKNDPKDLLSSINQSIDYVKINNLMATWLSNAAEITQ